MRPNVHLPIALALTMSAGCAEQGADAPDGGLLPPVGENLIEITSREPASREETVFFGAAFAQGEIDAPCAAISVEGYEATSQCTPQKTYPDGSLRYAAFAVQRQWPADETVSLRFAGSASPAGEPITTEELLASECNLALSVRYDATTQAISSDGLLQQMVSRGIEPRSTRVRGPLATEFVIEDRAERRDDFLVQGAPVSPAFHILALRRADGSLDCDLRFVLEQTQANALRTVQLDGITVSAGRTQPQTVYEEDGFTIGWGSLQSKEFYFRSGQSVEFPKIDIKHRMATLTAPGVFLPNYDPDRAPSAETTDQLYAAWMSADRSLDSSAATSASYGATGGRGELGMFTEWAVNYLYTGSWKMRLIQNELVEVAAKPTGVSMAEHRDVAYGYGDAPSGRGRPITLPGRPTLFMHSNSNTGVGGELPQWLPDPNGQFVAGTVAPDLAHTWNPYSQYLFAPKEFYLRVLSYWLSGPSFWDHATNRSRTGAYMGLFYAQPRGMARFLMTILMGAQLSPTGSPEEALFDAYLKQQLAYYAGVQGVDFAGRTDDPQQSEQFEYAREEIAPQWFAPLGRPDPEDVAVFVVGPTPPQGYPGYNWTATHPVARGGAYWMLHLMGMSFGHVYEQTGLDSARVLLDRLTRLCAQITVDAGIPVHVLAAYQSVDAVGDAAAPAGMRYPTAQEHIAAYQDPYCDPGSGVCTTLEEGFVHGVDHANHGYTNLLRAMLSFSVGADLPGATALWAALDAEGVISTPALDQNPQLALLPRP